MFTHDPAIHFHFGGVELGCDSTCPKCPRGAILFADDSAGSRKSPRQRRVVGMLQDAGFATLWFDLLSESEVTDERAHLDVPRLTDRLIAMTHWVELQERFRGLPIGYFGASVGAAAALRAAAAMSARVKAVVSRGGRPDLAREDLADVHAPTLFIVAGGDRHVLKLNRQAAVRMTCPYRLAVVEGATPRFEEPGALETVNGLATEWFERHVGSPIAISVEEAHVSRGRS